VGARRLPETLEIIIAMSQIYVMLLTYESLKKAEREIREISEEVKSLSGGDFKISLRTSESMMLLFTSSVPPVDLKARMKGLAYGEARYALFSVDQLQVGYLEQHVLDWLALRIHQSKKS